MTDELNKEIVQQSIENGLFPGGVHLFDSIESTNDWSLEECKRGRTLPFVCIADHQSKGRGRRGRHWLSPSGANIYMSIAWRFDLPPEKLGALSLAQGIAVIKTLARIGIDDAWLKWPNDVLVNEEKIAGILVETHGIRDGSCNTVIGIGLNYRMPEHLSHETDIHWTDVAQAGGTACPDRSRLAAMLLNDVVDMCRQYQQKANAILFEFKNVLDEMNGRNVCVHLEDGDRLAGTVLGVSETGELRVLIAGEERVFNSADVSLRKPGEQSDAGDLC